MTLGVVGRETTVLDPRVPIGESGLRSGSIVEISRVDNANLEATAVAAAVVTVLAGPDAGKEFSLQRGTNLIGRDRTCEVRLKDPLVSRQHARLNIRRRR